MEFAEILGRPPKTVSEILSGKKAITPETAQGLGEAFGVDPQFWMNLERVQTFTPANSEGRGCTTCKAVRRRTCQRHDPTWVDPSKRQPRGPRAAGNGLPPRSERSERSQPLTLRRGSRRVTPRRHRHKWLGCVESSNLRQALAFIHSTTETWIVFSRNCATTVSEEEARHVPRLLSDFGIRFLVVEHLPKTRIDGVAMWLGESPVVALSMRYDRIDAFWHTLAHELAHIAKRHVSSLDDDIIDDSGSTRSERPEIEIEADAIACDKLVSKAELESFIARIRPLYSRSRINQFANRIQVHPGIIIGQLQRRGEINYSQLRESLVKVREIVTQSAVTDGWGCVSPIS